MEKKREKVRFVYRRSSLIVKIIVLVTVALLIGTLIFIKVKTEKTNKLTEKAWSDAASQEQENQVVQEHIDQIGTPQSTERIAREELDLYPSDSVIFETTE